MDIVILKASKRDQAGSRKARSMRLKGNIPAVVYGHGMMPVSITIDKGAMAHTLHTKAGENVVIDLQVEGAALKENTCVIKDIQHNPVTDEIQHVDFTVISLKEKIEVQIPLIVLHAEEAEGIKAGGVLDVVHHEISVECLPTNIPEDIEIDIKKLKIGDVLHVKDLPIPQDIACLLEEDEVVVAIHHPKVEEEPVEEAEELTQPEVIEKGKKDKEEEDGEAKPQGDAPKKAEPKEKA